MPFKTYLYFIAQSINLTAAVMSVTMAAIVGLTLAPTTALSTLPYGFQFLLLMLVTYPAAKLMARWGRKPAFILATLPLAASGVTGFIAVQWQSFSLLIISHALLGMYMAFANFNRFAATDGLAANLKSKAISLVVAGGVLAAFSGPLLTNYLKDIANTNAFAACYLAFVGLAFLSLLINILIKESPVTSKPITALDITHDSASVVAKNDNTLSIKRFKLSQPILLAIAVAAIGQGIMTLLMIQASLHMAELHVHFSDISSAIQWHVLAMFAPSFFTGVLIQRLGLKTIVFSGLLLMISTNLINLTSNSHSALSLALIVLGLGWNFTFVGGSALLTKALGEQDDAIRIQGINDLGVAILTTCGAFLPAVLLSWMGWSGTNLISIGLVIAVLLFAIYVFKQEQINQNVNHQSF